MARNPNRGSGGRTTRDYNKKYTDKDRPSGWYQVEGKGKRWWNSYTNKWTRSPVGSTDDMIRQANKEGKIPKATNRGTPRSGGRTSTTNKDKTPDRPTGTTRNWRNGHGAQSDKPSSGDPSTWKKKTETTSSSGSSGGGGSSSGSSGSSGSSSSSSSGSSTPPRRNGAGVKTPLSGGAGGTRPTGPGPKEKPKSRLEKALSGIGKWEEPKEKSKRNKPTSRFLKDKNKRKNDR